MNFNDALLGDLGIVETLGRDRFNRLSPGMSKVTSRPSWLLLMLLLTSPPPPSPSYQESKDATLHLLSSCWYSMIPSSTILTSHMVSSDDPHVFTGCTLQMGLMGEDTGKNRVGMI